MPTQTITGQIHSLSELLEGSQRGARRGMFYHFRVTPAKNQFWCACEAYLFAPEPAPGARRTCKHENFVMLGLLAASRAGHDLHNITLVVEGTTPIAGNSFVVSRPAAYNAARAR